jgi:hypothetical protein
MEGSKTKEVKRKCKEKESPQSSRGFLPVAIAE